MNHGITCDYMTDLNIFTFRIHVFFSCAARLFCEEFLIKDGIRNWRIYEWFIIEFREKVNFKLFINEFISFAKRKHEKITKKTEKKIFF